MADTVKNDGIEKTLTKAFTASSKKDATAEKRKFSRIIEAAMKTETGRETLKTLTSLGYSFAFEKGEFGGYCDPDNKRIVINPSVSFEYSCGVVVHEATHAIQDSLEDKEKMPSWFETKVADYLRNERATEADATAHENAFLYECKDVLPKVYQYAKEINRPMFNAYVAEMEKSGDKKAAMQSSFAAWYEFDDYRKTYDNHHKGTILEVADWGKSENDKECFSKEYPAEDVLKMCLFEGKPYMTPEFLNTGKAFSITKKDRDEMTKKISDYAKAVGVAPDTSLMTMNLRDEQGNLIKTAAPKQSLMSKIRDAQKTIAGKFRPCKGRDGGR